MCYINMDILFIMDQSFMMKMLQHSYNTPIFSMNMPLDVDVVVLWVVPRFLINFMFLTGLAPIYIQQTLAHYLSLVRFESLTSWEATFYY